MVLHRLSDAQSVRGIFMATVPVTVERYTAPENDADYIDMGTAVKMGFGSPNTLNRWVKQGCVRNFKEGQRRLLNVADLVQRARERDVIDVNVAYDDLLFRLTSFAPVFSDEQKQRLAALLSA